MLTKPAAQISRQFHVPLRPCWLCWQSRKEVNELDNLTTGKAVDALLNYETVKLFNNEKREVCGRRSLKLLLILLVLCPNGVPWSHCHVPHILPCHLLLTQQDLGRLI